MAGANLKAYFLFGLAMLHFAYFAILYAFIFGPPIFREFLEDFSGGDIFNPGWIILGWPISALLAGLSLVCFVLGKASFGSQRLLYFSATVLYPLPMMAHAIFLFSLQDLTGPI